MKPKKNPGADLRRRSFLFFQVGLILMLFLAWQAIEWKHSTSVDNGPEIAEVIDDLDDIPITMRNTPPPPPPPPPPITPVIEVVDDDEDVKEEIIGDTETSQDDIIEDIEDIVEAEDEPIEEIPFVLIENVPVYPGCENAGDNNARKTCMEEKIKKFINKKFNTELANDLGLEGRQVIRAVFKIDQNGNIIGVGARAPHPALETEASRVLNQLPKMTPGMQRGKPVIVSYGVPIVFQVEN